MTVAHKLFKILSGHDVANGRTDRQTDGRTDGQTPYHNTSEVLLRAYKKGTNKQEEDDLDENMLFLLVLKIF